MLAKFFLPLIFITLSSPASSAVRIRCAPESTYVPPGTTLESYSDFFRLYSVVPKTEVSLTYVEQFKNEMSKFPLSLQRELNRAGNKIHILEGEGVTVDPTWEPVHEKTFDGRPWSDVPGSGGSTARGHKKAPTRIVINSMYAKHGSANLLLHEHAHSLDSISTLHGISNSLVWTRIQEMEPGVTKFLDQVCGKYCTENVEEGFAELFANYYGCAKSRQQMEQELPLVSKFFSRFHSTKKISSLMDDVDNIESDADQTRSIHSNESIEERLVRVLRAFFKRRLSTRGQGIFKMDA